MGDLLRRRMMILPGDGLPEWDYEWDYTMGLLSNNGWEKKVSGTASETLTSTGDSLKSSGIVMIWLIINELISILENVAAIGGPTPPFVTKLLSKLKNTVEDKAGTVAGDREEVPDDD